MHTPHTILGLSFGSCTQGIPSTVQPLDAACSCPAEAIWAANAEQGLGPGQDVGGLPSTAAEAPLPDDSASKGVFSFLYRVSSTALQALNAGMEATQLRQQAEGPQLDEQPAGSSRHPSPTAVHPEGIVALVPDAKPRLQRVTRRWAMLGGSQASSATVQTCACLQLGHPQRHACAACPSMSTAHSLSPQEASEWMPGTCLSPALLLHHMP